MFTFGETLFCEKVILNWEGSLRESIRRFTKVHSTSYPFRFNFSVVTDLFFDDALYKWLSICRSDSMIIFEGGWGLFSGAAPKNGILCSKKKIDMP